MTIDSAWLACFKEEVPEAFTPKPQFRPVAMFSDGQIRLMQNAPTEPQTWDNYISARFVRYYQQFLGTIDTLVIAFDNYRYVPLAKSMTQTKRRQNITSILYSETSPLPCMVPEGESWTQHMSNRVFKMKVIELLVLKLPSLILARHPGKTVIIDYDVPVKYSIVHGEFQREVLSDMPAKGEADIKFVRWADKYRSIVIDSIDGDTVPIALIHHERMLAAGEVPPRVAVYRMQINLQSASSRKRARTDTSEDGAAAGGDGAAAAQQPAKKQQRNPRQYEFLDVQLLYMVLRQSIRQLLGPLKLPLHEGHEIRMITCLVILSGTDFTRNLPWLTGKSIWDMLCALWMPLMNAYNPDTQQVNANLIVDKVIATCYATKFHRHIKVCNSAATYATVHQDIKGAKGIGQRVKESLPDRARVLASAKNCNWVLQYWYCEDFVPDCIRDGDYGYLMVRGGKPQYEDEAGKP